MNDTFDDPSSRLRRAAEAGEPAPELDPGVVSGAPEHHAPRLVRHGRVARGAGLGLVAVAAVSVGALVIGNPLGTPEPIFAAAGGSGATEATTMDNKLAYWVNYDYVAGPSLSDDGGRGTVYELRRTGDPEDVLAAAAAAVGLEGEARVSSYSSPEYPSYVIGPEDGSDASLSLSWAGTGDWWYNDPTAYPEPICVPTTVQVDGPDGPTTETYDDCQQPEIPASESLAPTADEARALAADIFAATGFDVDASDIRVTADAWQTIASASLTVDGVTTALESSVGWTALGEIAWASGHSVEVANRGDYDTVSQVAGVDRLSDPRWYGAAGPDYTGNAALYAADSGVVRDGAEASSTPPAPDVDVPETPESIEGSDPSAPVDTPPAEQPGDPGVDPGTEPSGEPTIEPIPEPLPEPTPETVTVTVDHAEATLLLMWDVDGNAWLVPGYAYQGDENGFWNAVVSLVDGVIALPEPIEIDPLAY